MDYPNQAKAIYQTAGVSASSVEAPRTIASACCRIDALNARLENLEKLSSEIAAIIGAVRPIAPGQIGGTNAPVPPSSGAVGRLNDAADYVHGKLSDIEGILQSVHRSLG